MVKLLRKNVSYTITSIFTKAKIVHLVEKPLKNQATINTLNTAKITFAQSVISKQRAGWNSRNMIISMKQRGTLTIDIQGYMASWLLAHIHTQFNY